MDRCEPPEASELITAGNPTDAAAVAAGPALGRALERVALHDLKNRMRATYRAQDAEDNARIEHLRRERNELIESLDQQAWNLRRDYGLAQAEYRLPWIDAHERTADARQASRRAISEAKRLDNPSDRAALEELRLAHRSAQDAFDAERDAHNLKRESALCELRSRWHEARGRVVDAKRALEQALKETSRNKERSALVNAELHTLRELQNLSSIGWQEVRRASMEHARATAELHAATVQNAPAELFAELQARVDSALEELGRLQDNARAADANLADALHATGPDANASAEARLRARLLEAHDEEALEKHRARQAEHGQRTIMRDANRAAEEDLRLRRNAEGETYVQAVRAIYAARGQREAELRREFIERRDEEQAALRTAKEEMSRYAEQAAPSLHSSLESLRKQKIAAQEAFSDAVNAINRTRGVERAEDRAQAREAAKAVIDRYAAP